MRPPGIRGANPGDNALTLLEDKTVKIAWRDEQLSAPGSDTRWDDATYQVNLAGMVGSSAVLRLTPTTQVEGHQVVGNPLWVAWSDILCLEELP